MTTREHTIRLRLPDGFDQILRAHAGEDALEITDAMRRQYLVALLAAVFDGLSATTFSDALIRLNGTLPPIVPRGGRVH